MLRWPIRDHKYPSARLSSIFCTTLSNKLKRGNAKNVSERQSRVKASTAYAPASAYQATYLES